MKNKVAAPFREAEFDIMYGEGISREGDLLDLAAAKNIVEKSGAWFSYKGERIGQGRENARQFLKDNKDTLVKLDAEVRKQLGLIPAAVPAAVPAAASSAPQSASDHHAQPGSGTGEGASGAKIERVMCRRGVPTHRGQPMRRSLLPTKRL